MADLKEGESTNPSDLAHAQITKLIELLPVIITLCVLGVFGIIGNIITIRFYRRQRRKKATFLITSLAIVDIVVCVLIAPNVAEMAVNVQYTSRAACKTMHFLGHWFVESSGLILGFIALDRYWTICSKRKVTHVIAKRVVITAVVFSLLMSVRDFANFDVITVNINTSQSSNTSSSVIGHYCSNSDDPSLKLSVLIFHGIDALTFLAILIVIVVTYSNVVWRLCKLRDLQTETMTSNRNHAMATSTDNLETDTKQEYAATSNTQDQQSDDHETEFKNKPRGVTIQEDLDTVASGTDKQTTLSRKTRMSRKKNTIRRSELNVTMLMLAVSVAFFVCAAPYFALRIGLQSVQRHSDLELGLLSQFGLRLSYVNSVLNPLIYCLFNPAFRRHVRRTLTCKAEPVDELYSFTTMSSG